MTGKPFILVGPSGVGKNTLVQAALEKYGEIFEKKISYTTRPVKQTPSKTGSLYHCISEEEFKAKVENKDFVEY